MTQTLSALFFFLAAASPNDGAVQMKIVKEDGFWYFEATCRPESGLAGRHTLEVMYQDTKNKSYYPLMFFEETKYIEIKEGVPATQRLYKSFKEPYALNYKVVIETGSEESLEYHLNMYDPAKLQRQVLAASKDLFADMLIIIGIEEELRKDINSIGNYKMVFNALEQKNMMRFDIQEAYLESKGKFIMDVLIRMLVSIAGAEKAGEKKAKLGKLSAYIRDYLQILDFHAVNWKQFGEIAGKIKTSAGAGRINECVNGLLKLSSILPRYMHDHIKTMIELVKSRIALEDMKSALNSKLDEIPTMIIMRE